MCAWNGPRANRQPASSRRTKPRSEKQLRDPDKKREGGTRPRDWGLPAAGRRADAPGDGSMSTAAPAVRKAVPAEGIHDHRQAAGRGGRARINALSIGSSSSRRDSPNVTGGNGDRLSELRIQQQRLGRHSPARRRHYDRPARGHRKGRTAFFSSGRISTTFTRSRTSARRCRSCKASPRRSRQVSASGIEQMAARSSSRRRR